MSDNNLLLDPGNDYCSGWRNVTLSVTVFSKGYAHPNNHSKRSMTSVFFSIQMYESSTLSYRPYVLFSSDLLAHYYKGFF